ncbi:putative aminotransferase, class-II [Serinicoccus hydrothermalis]|uniref:Putative aminotransferase, class-II n=1 Tax=Serinicoccus hydrothermalis TaxID=1758689 RepID=A0A1B1N922_9MICO|nr:hypothetical protein [Serinicoccus hydrothermalis]ANS77943.1 putative aminotransferase, class-II [Serinicoccus hydrothermalis]
MALPVNRLRRLAWRGLAALPAPVRDLAALPVRRRADAELRALAPMPAAARRLYVGPWNTAGQGYAWAHAAQEHLTGVAAQNLAAARSLAQPGFRFPADHELSVLAQRGHVRSIHGERVLREATHVLFESGRPVLGDLHARSMLDDVAALDAAGVRHAVVYHGSEIRDLRQHAAAYPHSPFGGEWDDYLRTLQEVVGRNARDLAAYPGTVLVSTPDLLDVLPGATWLPLVVDVDRFAAAPGRRALGRERPVVLHAPSNPRLKGTEVVERVLEGLQSAGLVEYRRLAGVPHEQMAAFVADADVVVDQVVLGNPGVLLAETLAAGRLAVAHLAAGVRERMARADRDLGGDGVVPVVEADAGTLEQALRDVLADRDGHTTLASRGPAWAGRHHDGRRAAAVLDQVLLSP